MSSKIMDWEDCVNWVRDRQAKKQCVVFTNGCFDLLHAGHIHLLREASQLGDYLVVGVNSDASVTRLKGPRRPVMGLEDRLAVLEAMTCVDVLVVFPLDGDPSETLADERVDTPYSLLQRLRPNVLVKGGDYRAEEVVGNEFVDEVCIVPLLEGHSTSKIIQHLGLALDTEGSVQD
ncbi:MAG: adenylyltransferase/cytidyltransferase family protein [Fidelibacterota bacterium]|nr:MAG: adenylyltransferase/cytidyltransferase family protein [Candidatus Neomarinimicrobiota bacterium]